MGCGKPSLSFCTGPKLPDAPFKPSKLLETCRTGSCRCQSMGCGKPIPFLLARNYGTLPSNLANAPNLRNLPNRLLELSNYGLRQAKSFYWSETAGCSLQALQTLQNFRNLPSRLLELPNTAFHENSIFLSWAFILSRLGYLYSSCMLTYQHCSSEK